MGSNDHDNHSNQIVKGKRTKRQRSLSPFGLTTGNVTASGSSSSSGDSGGGGAEGERGVVDDCCYYNNNNNNSASSSTTSGEIYESTEEEEDMANCLIMLAQGDAPRLQIQDTFKTEKLSSRRFSGLITTSSTKTSFCVYECKTCNRSFPSFQALGGHRASHKKPKATAEDQKKTSSSSMVLLPFKEDMEEASTPPPPPPPPPTPPPPAPTVGVSMQVGVNATTKASKIHECSICGSEFTSGQALGGHMRRHRAATGNSTNNQVVMMTSDVVDASTTIVESKPRSILPLDLNLPAPEDDHLRDSKFKFGSSTQQAHSLVFSAPALVDCHY